MQKTSVNIILGKTGLEVGYQWYKKEFRPLHFKIKMFGG